LVSIIFQDQPFKTEAKIEIVNIKTKTKTVVRDQNPDPDLIKLALSPLVTKTMASRTTSLNNVITSIYAAYIII